MPLPRFQKAGISAVGCFSASKILKRLDLTIRIVQMMLSVNTGRTTSVISRWPASCFRWDIKVSYYENKTFWSWEEYHVRSHEGIEHLVNLENIAYSAMTLLLSSDESFSCYQSASA